MSLRAPYYTVRRTRLTQDEARRLCEYTLRVGMRNAAARLRVGEVTIETAREEGGILPETRARLLAALDREEASG